MQKETGTGDSTLSTLADELEDRGLTYRPGSKTSGRPVPHNKLQAILRNRYYLGYVTWRGVEHDGKHPPLVSPDVFERVRQMLTDHRTSKERGSKRSHYLVGSLRCGRCGSRMLYMVSRGKLGTEYGYFYCASRNSSVECNQRFLPEQMVEEAVEA